MLEKPMRKKQRLKVPVEETFNHGNKKYYINITGYRNWHYAVVRDYPDCYEGTQSSLPEFEGDVSLTFNFKMRTDSWLGNKSLIPKFFGDWLDKSKVCSKQQIKQITLKLAKPGEKSYVVIKEM